VTIGGEDGRRDGDSEGAAEALYCLTEKGRELLLVIISLARWGMKWTDAPEEPPQLIHTRCGSEMSLDFRCPTCGEEVGPGEIRVQRRSAEDRTEQQERQPVEAGSSGSTASPAMG
jgi:hypothetical protein